MKDCGDGKTCMDYKSWVEAVNAVKSGQSDMIVEPGLPQAIGRARFTGALRSIMANGVPRGKASAQCLSATSRGTTAP